jgi:TolB-like protein
MSPEQTSGGRLIITSIFRWAFCCTRCQPVRPSKEVLPQSWSPRFCGTPWLTELRPDLPSDRRIGALSGKGPAPPPATARDVSNEPRPRAPGISEILQQRLTSLWQRRFRPCPADEGFWVAVLPFKSKGTDAGLDALAEGITEEIITGMSRFPYLRVIAHGSTQRYANQAVDLRNVGKELGARYVMEGSLRQAGPRLRIAAKLVDATTGTQLWVETYDRSFQAEAIFDSKTTSS